MNKVINNIRKLALVMGVLTLAALHAPLSATHIVGADMTFECLGNDFYQIDLVVRRDCINGADDAPFDNPAVVGIFDALGNPLDFLGRFGTVEMPIISVDTIFPVLPECAYLGSEVCVEEARYTATVYLPFREKGYVLAYQRCCRNITLNNIVDPTNTGNTSFVCLTEPTLNSCNSMPAFDEWPEIVICQDEPFVFDHSAFDRDGDSLVYELYTPHAGATEARPKPVPPPGPEYDTVEYTEGFSLTNFLGVGEALTIDSRTGVINAVPGVTGQFLVGILVEEWRDGEVLSKTRRNFELNVRVCEDVANLGFEAPVLTCDGLTVTFDNTSTKNFGYNWNFNFASDDPAFLSTEESPTFTFPEQGVYEVKLSSTNPENGCEISVIKDIAVYDSELLADFEIVASECANGTQNIRLTATSVEPNESLTIEDHRWEVVVDDQVIPLFGAVVETTIECADTIMISLISTSSNGCSDIEVKSIDLGGTSTGPLIDLQGDTLRICIGDEIALFNEAIEGVTYSFDPTTDLSFTDTVNFSDPIARPTETTAYEITATNGLVTESATTLVIVDMKPEFTFGADSTRLCRSGSQIPTIDGDPSYDYQWDPSEQVNTGDPYSPNDPLFLPTEDGYFYVTVTNGACVIVDSVYVEAIGIDPVALDEALVTEPQIGLNEDGTINLNVPFNIDELSEQFEIVSVSWEIITENETITGDGTDISATIQPATMATVNIFITDSDGCITKITRVIDLRDTPTGPLINLIGDTIRICIGDETALFNSAIEGVTYSFDPTTDLSFTDTVNFSDPIASPTETTTYEIIATNGLVSDSATTVVIVDMKPEFTFGTDSTRLCRSGSQIPTIDGDPSYEYQWDPSEQVNIGDPYSPNDPLFLPTEDGYFYVTVTNGACVIVDSVYVEAIGIDPVALDEALVSQPQIVKNDDGTISLDVPFNIEELSEQFEIVSVTWEIITENETFTGDGTEISATIQPATMATVNIFITDSDGCITKITRIIDLGDTPTIEFIMEDTIGICAGDTSFVVANPNSEWTYTWDPEEGLIFADPADKSNPQVSIEETTTYRVTVSNGITSVVDSVVVEVLDTELDISIDPSGGNICDGEAIVAALNNTNDQDAFYEWALDPNFETIVATGQNVTIPIEGDMATIYLRANSQGFCGSNIASLDVVNNSVNITPDFDPINTCVGPNTDVQLINNADSQRVTIQWEASNNIISDDLTSPIIEITRISDETEVQLTYTATNDLGCSTTQTITVPVVDELIVTIGGDTQSCTTIGTFSADANADNEAVNFEWSLTEDFAEIIGIGDSITADLGATGIIYLRGSTDNCVSNVVSQMLDMRDLNLDFDAPSRICPGDTADVDLIFSDGESFDVIWEENPSIVSELTGSKVFITGLGGNDTITLRFIADDGEGCLVDGEIQVVNSMVVDPNPVGEVICGTLDQAFSIDSIYMDGNVLWDFSGVGGSPETSTLANPTISFDSAGIYQATITSTMETCNFDETDVFFQVPEILEIITDQDPNQVLCMDSILMLRATSNGVAITWTDGEGNLLAVGDSVEINAANITQVTASTLDANGCSEELVFTISMYMFDVTIDAPTEPACDAGDGIQVSATDNTGANVSYEWTSAAGGVISGGDTATPTIDPANSEDLQLTVTNEDLDCSMTFDVPVTGGSLESSISSDPVDGNIILGDDATITVTPSGDGITYQWDDGSTEGPVRTVMPDMTTTYTVTITDMATGCTAVEFITITVDVPDCTDAEGGGLFLPTAFSPNNDNVNDVLIARGNIIDEVDLQIFDRWGKEVFRGMEVGSGWNGQYRNTGDNLPPDVYAFSLYVRCFDGMEFLKSGHVSLVR